MVIILTLFVLGAIIYAVLHGLVAAAILIACIGIPGIAAFAIMRAHGKKKMVRRPYIKHWDYADGEPPPGVKDPD